MNAMTLAHRWLKQDIWTCREQLATGEYHARLPEYLRRAHVHAARHNAHVAKQARAAHDPRVARLEQAKRDLELKSFRYSIAAEQRRIDDRIDAIVEAA